MTIPTTKATHTPGPWRYHLGRGANPRFHVQGLGGYQVASTTELNKHPMAKEENEMREHNARLIAAAPDLLAALKEAEAALAEIKATAGGRPTIRMRHDSGHSLYAHTLVPLAKARAAIARAEGGAE